MDSPLLRLKPSVVLTLGSIVRAATASMPMEAPSSMLNSSIVPALQDTLFLSVFPQQFLTSTISVIVRLVEPSLRTLIIVHVSLVATSVAVQLARISASNSIKFVRKKRWVIDRLLCTRVQLSDSLHRHPDFPGEQSLHQALLLLLQVIAILVQHIKRCIVT